MTAVVPIELSKHFKLRKWMFREPVVYIRLDSEGYYVGESTNLRHRYTVTERESLVYVKRACRNKLARRHQEQDLIESLRRQGVAIANKKHQTLAPGPHWTLCDTPDKPASGHKRQVPDPDSDPD